MTKLMSLIRGLWRPQPIEVRPLDGGELEDGTTPQLPGLHWSLRALRARWRDCRALSRDGSLNGRVCRPTCISRSANGTTKTQARQLPPARGAEQSRFKLHWARPARSFEEAEAYVLQLLEESLGNKRPAMH